MKVFIILFLIICMFCSCFKTIEQEDDKLPYSPVPYNGKELRIDGYYYNSFDGNVSDIFFLYQNGVFCNYGFFDTDNFEKIDTELRDIRNVNHLKTLKFSWGVFKIDSVSIQMSGWAPLSGGGPLKVGHLNAQLIGDTAFSYVSGSILSTFRFRPFSPKPDSTNRYTHRQ